MIALIITVTSSSVEWMNRQQSLLWFRTREAVLSRDAHGEELEQFKVGVEGIDS